MGENEVCGLLDLELGGGVVDAKEGEGLGYVEAEPELGGVLAEEGGDVVEVGGTFRGGFDEAARGFLVAVKDEVAVVGAEALQGLRQLRGWYQDGLREASR